jgi:Ca2+-binding EF-hand superfamily protein
MGENYTDQEIALLLSLVDPDGLGIVEFPEMIRWWCDDTGEE